ncbi:hypothetical protein Goklo_029676 [Gossypium klotzschianum]|uniref:Uncharacterized protein n=1 Tax=Gossypium klotzschianum TaxID=34286 RepID=A0A7J8WDP2_9ROSI|nr:hypothetical protein [Gossypium klotzschianum]
MKPYQSSTSFSQPFHLRRDLDQKALVVTGLMLCYLVIGQSWGQALVRWEYIIIPLLEVLNLNSRSQKKGLKVLFLINVHELLCWMLGWILQNNSLVRQPGNADRDREMLRVPNSAAVQGEDRTLAGAVDGWEKAKMKKKRSGIKPDVSPSMVSTKPIEGYREPKQGIQQRPVSDARSRLNNDSHEFRSGISNGSAGVGKSEGISLPTGLGPRSSVSRTDLDNSSLRNDKRDRPVASDKERVNLRAVNNRMSVRDEFNSASPTSNTKMSASIRGPRSGSGVAPKLSPVVHRTASNDWELSHCTNKPPTAGGVNNRKRTISTQSSSPPVAHWASQRPQKSSRSARRTNLVPVLSNNDETPLLDTVSDMPGNEIGSGYSRRLSSGSPQQVKLKGDALSSAALSESEESGAAEIKCKGKVTKFDEIDEKAGQNVQKVSNLILPSRKNKLINGEDIGDGVRRQGRTGRGITTTRSLMPMTVEKYGNVGTAKQLRSARLGLDKAESKAGRPPTRKLTDRKPYARQKHAAINAAADLLVGSTSTFLCWLILLSLQLVPFRIPFGGRWSLFLVSYLMQILPI